MDLRDVVALTWKRRWLVAGVLVVCVALSGAFVAMQPKRYESTASLALTPDTRGQTLIAPDALAALLGTYAETAKSRLLLRRASTPQRPLRSSIKTDTVAGTGILRIIARSASPEQAAADANAVAAAFRQSIASNSLILATLVDQALPEASPVQPRPKLTLAVAAILGLFAGVVLAFVLEQLRRRVTTPDEVRAITQAPLLGRLPRNRGLARKRASLVWDDESDIEIQESYRALRTNLRFVFPARTGLVQITSPEPEAGKSTVSANLAIALGQIGIKTILVDADLRRPRVHEIFELDNRIGLSSFMAEDEADPLRALMPSGHDNLLILPSGPPPLDPTEMISIRIGAILARLRQLNVLVVVDTPPLLPVSDARLVAPHTDGVIVVVASGSERPARLQLALERLSLAGAPLLGLVLNKARSDGMADSGTYRYGGYTEEVDRVASPSA